jgi:hypothetical protein
MTAAALGKLQPLQRRFADQSTRGLAPPAPGAAAGEAAARSLGASGSGRARGGGGGRWGVGAGFRQEVVVTLCGTVVTRAQAEAGAYVPREEREEAARLAAGACGNLDEVGKSGTNPS